MTLKALLLLVLMMVCANADWRQDIIPDGAVYTGLYSCAQGFTVQIFRIVDWPVIRSDFFALKQSCSGIGFVNFTLNPNGKEILLSFINYTYNPCNYVFTPYTAYVSKDGLYISGNVCSKTFTTSRVSCAVQNNTTVVPPTVGTPDFPTAITATYGLTAEVCCAICNGDANCRAYVFDSSIKSCQLFSSINGTTQAENMTFGYSQNKFVASSTCFCWGDDPIITTQNFQIWNNGSDLQTTLKLCSYCPVSLDVSQTSSWCLYDGRIIGKGKMENQTVICPTPYLVAGIHTLSIAITYDSSTVPKESTIWYFAGDIIVNSQNIYSNFVNFSYSAWYSQIPTPTFTSLSSDWTDVSVVIQRVFGYALSPASEISADAIPDSGVYFIGDEISVYKGTIAGFSTIIPEFSATPFGIDVAVQFTFTLSNSTSNVTFKGPWIPKIRSTCYGQYCGDPTTCPSPTSNILPTDDFDAYCKILREKTSPFTQSDANVLVNVLCSDSSDVLLCLHNRQMEIQARALADPSLIWPPIITSSDIILASQIKQVQSQKRYFQVITWAVSRATQILVQRSATLAAVETGVYTPDANSRLGAFAATAGYPPGTVGNSVHHAIGTIYMVFGTFGEETIGTVFNSAEAKALYSQSVNSEANRQIATLEFNYWNARRNTFGGYIATLFSVECRVQLQQNVFTSNPAPDVGLIKRLSNTVSNYGKTASTCFNSVKNAIFGKTYGDPHFTNFDGCYFNFQGIGDFILTQTIDMSFAIHARMRKQSLFPIATMMSAFAIRAGFHLPVVQFQAIGLGAISVRFNRYHVVIPVGHKWRIPGISMTVNTNSVTIQYSSGISLQFTTSSNNYEGIFWGCQINLPAEFAGQTIGLLGNSNGNPYDDFVNNTGDIFLGFTNETCASMNQNQTRLNEWGYSWLLKNNVDSLFFYENSLKTTDFTDPSFKAPSPSEIIANSPVSLVNNANSTCRILPDPVLQIGCMYDYIISGGTNSPVTTYQIISKISTNYLLLQNVTHTFGNSTNTISVSWNSSQKTNYGPVFLIEYLDGSTWVPVLNSTYQFGVNITFNNVTNQQSYMVRVVLIKDASGILVLDGTSQSILVTLGECVPYCPQGYCSGDLCGGQCYCTSSSGDSVSCSAILNFYIVFILLLFVF